MADPVVVEVGSTETEGIALTILGRSHPSATDYWDGNWVRTAVAAKVGGFTAAFGADLRADELERLRVGLEVLYDNLEGEAIFETLEGCVFLRFQGDGRGHVHVEAELIDQPGTGNRLRGSLDLDQTYLPPIIASLRTVAHHWPVLGTP